MKGTVIGLIIVLLVFPISCSPPYVPEIPPPIPEMTFPTDYIETQFSTVPGEVYRLNIFAEKGELIEGSWKADEAIYAWYVTPGGVPMRTGVESPITPPTDEYYHDQSVPAIGATWGDTFSLYISGQYRGKGYYTFCFMPFSRGGKSIPVIFRHRIGKPVQESQSTQPQTQESQSIPTPATNIQTYFSPSAIDNTPPTSGKEIRVSGQVYFMDNQPKLLIDGKTGIILTGDIASLNKGIFRLSGLYDVNTNTLNVSRAVEVKLENFTIDIGKNMNANLVPISLQGLVATPPKEITDTITSYIAIPHLPENLTVYPYVVYREDGLYLALSDTVVDLPARFSFFNQGKDHTLTFSSGEVKGVLLKIPLAELDLGGQWTSNEFQGIIIADTITPLQPIEATVREIMARPDYFIFKRVSIQGSYLVTTATVDYSDLKVPMGQGILADDFSDFFKEDPKTTLETIDPEANAWQLRECWIIGTVIYPTEEILKYLDYSAPVTKSEVVTKLKPALIVDTILDDTEQVADISQLNPITGNPSLYWGKVVEFEGYALGINYPMKQLAVTNTDIPININLLAVGIADRPLLGSQLVIIGLNNDLSGDQGELIIGRYRFKIAVTQVPQQLVTGISHTDTAFFLLSKEKLP